MCRIQNVQMIMVGEIEVNVEINQQSRTSQKDICCCQFTPRKTIDCNCNLAKAHWQTKMFFCVYMCVQLRVWKEDKGK